MDLCFNVLYCKTSFAGNPFNVEKPGAYLLELKIKIGNCFSLFSKLFYLKINSINFFFDLNEKSDPEDECLNHFNLFISLVGRYFEQIDLADKDD